MSTVPGTFLPWFRPAALGDAYYILCRHYHDEPLVRERMDAGDYVRSLS